jgi:hypothetical protein
MIIPRKPNAPPRHVNAYTRDTNGALCIMQIGIFQGEQYRTIVPDVYFSDYSEARRYCRDWNEFSGAYSWHVVEREVR